MSNSVKITVELKCAQCGNKIAKRGKSVISRHRRWGVSSRVYIDDVWTTDWFLDDGEPIDTNSIEITKGYSYDEDSDEDLYCSQKCVLDFVIGVLPKLKTDHELDGD